MDDFVFFGKLFGKSALFEEIKSGIESGFIAVCIPITHACAGINQNDDAGTSDEVLPLRMKIINEQSAQYSNPQGKQDGALPLFEFDGIDSVSSNEIEE